MIHQNTEPITKSRKDEGTKEEGYMEQKALFRGFQFSCFRGEDSVLISFSIIFHYSNIP